MASIQVPEIENEAVTVPSITATPAVAVVPDTPAGTLSDRQDAATGKGSSDHQSARTTAAAAAAEDDDAEYPQGVRFILIMLVVAFDVFLVALDQTIVSTAVPQVTNGFNSFSDVGWYGSAVSILVISQYSIHLRRANTDPPPLTHHGNSICSPPPPSNPFLVDYMPPSGSSGSISSPFASSSWAPSSVPSPPLHRCSSSHEPLPVWEWLEVTRDVSSSSISSHLYTSGPF